MIRGILIALAIALGPLTVAAQVRVVRSGDDRLSGIDAVDVLVTQTATGDGCALPIAALRKAAVDALGRAGLRATASEKARSWFHSIVIDVHTTLANAICASAVTTELVTEVEGIPDADRQRPPGTWGSLLRGYMPLVRETVLVTAPPASHDASVQTAVEAHAFTVAMKIRSVNH